MRQVSPGTGPLRLSESDPIYRSLDRARQAVVAAGEQLRHTMAAALTGSAPRERSMVESGGGRYLVYAHGICRHDPGYSDPWWKALHPFTTAFGDGTLGDRRREVLWSDLVGEQSLTATSGVAASERAEWAARVRGVLEDRAANFAMESGPSVASRELSRSFLTEQFEARELIAPNASAALNLNVPGLKCVDGFSVYMSNDEVRGQIIGRFTDVVRPLLDSGAELDIISHSWGTVVAYEGLRELEDAGLTTPKVRNFFTVGAALSIFLVKLRLRPANRDGHRPAMVRRWINLNAHGDPVGGSLQGHPYQVDAEFLDLPNLGCGFLNASCAHGSYFLPNNLRVNQDIFAAFIDQP